MSSPRKPQNPGGDGRSNGERPRRRPIDLETLAEALLASDIVDLDLVRKPRG